MFYFDDFFGKKILKSTLLSDYDCFFTTRDFVLTHADLLELETQSKQNREFLKQKLNNKEIITAKQVHSDNIEKVEQNKIFYDNTDALISDIPNSLMLMNFADCVPIILYSKKENTGALIHAGWRGTKQEIAFKTVQKMNIPPEHITALIGPSIGKCHFETDEDVFKQLVTTPDANTDLYEVKNILQCHPELVSGSNRFETEFKTGKMLKQVQHDVSESLPVRPGIKLKYFIDLKLLNYNQLIKAGIKDIDVCNYCTFCMSDIFFSYRKEKGLTARHSAVVKIKGENICQ